MVNELKVMRSVIEMADTMTKIFSSPDAIAKARDEIVAAEQMTEETRAAHGQALTDIAQAEQDKKDAAEKLEHVRSEQMALTNAQVEHNGNVQKLRKAASVLDERKLGLDEEEAALNTKAEQLKEREEKLVADETAFAERVAALDAREAQIAEDEARMEKAFNVAKKEKING